MPARGLFITLVRWAAMNVMTAEHQAILAELIAEVVRLDATALELDYDEGFEEVVVFRCVTCWGSRRRPGAWKPRAHLEGAG